MSSRQLRQADTFTKSNRSLLPNGMPLHEVDIKVVCVGAANTGKTTFLRYWETGQSSRHTPTTIQMEFHRREMTISAPPWSYFQERDQNVVQPSIPSLQTRGMNSPSDISTGSHASEGCSETVRPFFSPKSLSMSLPNPFGPDYAMGLPPLSPFHHCVRRHPLVSLPAIVKVWDIQGQESTKRMTRVFYTGAVATLIFCELSSGVESLTSALSWRSDVLEKIRLPRSLPNGAVEVSVPCWLVVNKYDLLCKLPAPPVWATRQALSALCARHGFAGWSYAAGRHGVNVEETLQALIAAAAEALPEYVCPQAGGVGGDGKGNAVGHCGTATVPRTRSRPLRQERGGCCER